MNIGDYVRTKDGIEKIIFIEENFFRKGNTFVATDNQKNISSYNGKYYGFSINKRKNNKRKKIKSSPNIIDLIEVGDLMFIDISPDDCGGIVVPRTTETENELQKYLNKINSGECILKGILTKEQIENGVYKL